MVLRQDTFIKWDSPFCTSLSAPVCSQRDTTTSDATCDNVLTYSLCIVSRAVLVSSGGAVTSSWDTCLQSDEGDRKDKILEWGSLNSTLQPVLGNTIDT